MQDLPAPLAVLGGGLIGSAARAAVGAAFPVAVGAFPATTLLVNLAGSLLLGLFLARRQRAVTRRWSLRFWAIGALGSFTTFSTFSVEVFRLLDRQAWASACGYVLASILFGLGAAVIGQRLGRVGR
ncbi:MAG: CrcB family protein [Acidimicrobiia bacterium]